MNGFNGGTTMKKLFTVMISLALFFSVAITTVWAGSGPSGPAPNSGDGVSDGSGFGEEGGPDHGPNSGNGNSQGPAPNSGDGVPDGSGF